MCGQIMKINWSIHKLFIVKIETNSAQTDYLLYKYLYSMVLRKTLKSLKNQQD